MSVSSRIVGVVVMLVLSAGVIPSVLAQDKTQDKNQGKDRNERKKKEELKSVYKNWLEQDVSYIITDEERKAFKALKTDEERDQFIEQFWPRRDPDPDTPETNTKNSIGNASSTRTKIYIRSPRLAYRPRPYLHNVRQARRARIHSRRRRLQSAFVGSAVVRLTYPFEDRVVSVYRRHRFWTEIEFVDPSGGEYRIARSPDERTRCCTCRVQD
jgi:hypothetical protein